MSHVPRYNNNNRSKGGIKNMAKKSITPSFRLNEEDYLKLKALKEEYGISWTKLVAHINKILEQEIKCAKEK